MPFISYAQNFEDIMLWRALKHVSKGFYIDVGANDPMVDSVTRAFYERGWHGINIEPMQQYQKRLRIERPSDINLGVAVGDSNGELTFFDIQDTGLSTMDATIAARHAASGKTIREWPVKLLRLDAICRQYVSTPIHFLKIDVEGFEDAALRGMDFKTWRPWILVIEATLPQTQTRNTDSWQELVAAADYQFAYFDGLNDFYVAAEHPELLPAFALAPNYFDDFTLRLGHHYSAPVTALEHEIWQVTCKLDEVKKTLHEANVWGQAVDTGFREHREHAASRIAQLESESAVLTAALAESNARTQQTAAALARESARAEEMGRQMLREHERAVRFEQLYHQTAATVASLYASTSWRITRPIRVLKRWAGDPHQALVDIRRKLAMRSLVAMPIPALPSAATGAQSDTTLDEQHTGMEDMSLQGNAALPASVALTAQVLRQTIDSTKFFK